MGSQILVQCVSAGLNKRDFRVCGQPLFWKQRSEYVSCAEKSPSSRWEEACVGRTLRVMILLK
jgi:hypothetical protein